MLSLLFDQVHHLQIIQYDDEAHTHDHYEYFRSLYMGDYGKALDRTLNLQLTLFDKICDVQRPNLNSNQTDFTVLCFMCYM